MQKLKTKITKWSEITPLDLKIAKTVKIAMTIVFFSVWLPALVYITGEVIKMIFE